MRSLFRRISAREEGFTLLELVVVTTLLMIVMTAILTSFEVVQKASVRESSRSEEMDTVRLAMEQMTKEIRQATDVRAGSSASFLDIDTYLNGVATHISFTATGTTLKRTAKGVTLTLLSRLSTTSSTFRSTGRVRGCESARHERRVQAGSLTDDAAAVADRQAAIAFGEDRRQWAGARRCQPQTQQMAPPFGLRPIDVSRPRMEDPVIDSFVRRTRGEEGVALIIAVVLMGVVATLAGLMLTVGVHTDQASARGRNWVQSLHVAESGVDQAMAKIQAAGGNYSGTFTGSTAQGSYSVTVSRQTRNQYTIRSVEMIRH